MKTRMTIATLVRLVAAPLPAKCAAKAATEDAAAKVAETAVCAGVYV